MLDIHVPKETLVYENKIINSAESFKKGINRGAMNAGRSIQKRIITNLNIGSRSGRKYRNLPNRSSAPGENPRSQNRSLERSVYYGASENKIVVGSNVDHATYLTEGTRYMEARPHKDLPFFELAMEQEERNTEEYLKKGVIDELC